jgi:hypothetical protein
MVYSAKFRMVALRASVGCSELNLKVEAEDLLRENHPGAIGFHDRLRPETGCRARFFRTLIEIFIIMSGGNSVREFNGALTAGDNHGFSPAQAAKITNFKTGTVKFRLIRARARLQAGLRRRAVSTAMFRRVV